MNTTIAAASPPSRRARITPRLMATIAERLRANQRVRRSLPDGGRIHIDRQLPFLCIYHAPTVRDEDDDRWLVTGEASYLITPGDPVHQETSQQLLKEIQSAMQPAFGAFLILELVCLPLSANPQATARTGASFRIQAPRDDRWRDLIDGLQLALGEIQINDCATRVRVKRAKRTDPAPAPDSKDTLHLRIEVDPIHRKDGTGASYPLVLRKLRHQLSHALRELFYRFAEDHTSHQPKHFHMLGRRAMVRAVWDADKKLSELVNSFDFMMLVTPTNSRSAWKEFKAQKYLEPPVFHYRPVPVSPATLKRALYDIPIERIEDPTLADLFEEKRVELDIKISMLLSRETARFRLASLQLHGEVDDELLGCATELLARFPKAEAGGASPAKKPPRISAEAFAIRAREELRVYREAYPAMKAVVRVRSGIPSLMVSRGNLLVGASLKVPVHRVEALIHHELGTHLLCSVNGDAQPFHMLRSGLPGYEELQEGLAVFSEYLAGGLDRSRMRILAARVVAVRSMADGAEFLDVFQDLRSKYGFGSATAFTIAMRVFRGGGFAKDAVYLRGILRLLQHIQAGGELDLLFLGKFSISHIPVIQELRWREVLKPARLQPRVLSLAGADARLARARRGLGPAELIEPL